MHCQANTAASFNSYILPRPPHTFLNHHKKNKNKSSPHTISHHPISSPTKSFTFTETNFFYSLSSQSPLYIHVPCISSLSITHFLFSLSLSCCHSYQTPMAPPSTTTLEGQSYTSFPTKPIKGDAFVGFSAIQSLIKPPTQNPPPKTETNTTFHCWSEPTSRMSEESLAMCTEGLGCETGVVDVVDEDMLGTLSSPLSPPPSPLPRRQRQSKAVEREFPPPMKSIEAVKYVKHREGQRLVVTAVRASTILKADRSGGRVRLCLNRVDVPPMEEEEEEIEEEEEERRRMRT
ncbi:Protein FANTASTIC FOUR 3 [Acorus gramineus]|uniref:Protein FANTASTIC FOUR 3 n=1 Tax=Acorus gramineus TaxID=55184 RepID=A0AAV9BQN2_ACOGR|nr:Protein FANTASTIC FOUR 3 [Acorus gramineus]